MIWVEKYLWGEICCFYYFENRNSAASTWFHVICAHASVSDQQQQQQQQQVLDYIIMHYIYWERGVAPPHVRGACRRWKVACKPWSPTLIQGTGCRTHLASSIIYLSLSLSSKMPQQMTLYHFGCLVWKTNQALAFDDYMHVCVCILNDVSTIFFCFEF